MCSAMFFVFWLAIMLFTIHANSQGIIFPNEDDKVCEKLSTNSICKDHRSCPDAFKNLPDVFPVLCGFEGNRPKVCCSVKNDRIENPDVTIPILDISPPEVDFECGDPIPSLVLPGRIKRSSVPPLAVAPPELPFRPDIVGGVDARRVVAKYTALIGFRDPNGKLDWFCTGVLLNRQWVLTAAHCNVREINVIRLGEHDYSSSLDGAFIEDFDVIENVPYPEYKDTEGYHDLALLKLSSEATLGSTVNPLCLPWGDASDKNLTNQKVTVAGWGTTEFGGNLSPVLQEVNVTVFDNSVCVRSYSELRSYELQWPRGMGEEILCIGDSEGGKDSCQGDSGGPATYLDKDNRYVLAAVVSRGYGCAMKDFPGLYANVHHKPYLAWMKNVAFKIDEVLQMEENDTLSTMKRGMGRRKGRN